MIKKYYQYNEGLFDLFKKKKKDVDPLGFEFELRGYKMDPVESSLYQKLK